MADKVPNINTESGDIKVTRDAAIISDTKSLAVSGKAAALNQVDAVQAEVKQVLLQQADQLATKGKKALLTKASDAKSKLKGAILGNLGFKLLKPKVFIVPEVARDSADLKGWFGTPVFSNLELPAGSYESLDGDLIEYSGVRIDTVLFTIGQARNIVKTAISGRNGTVKQYISDGDFTIEANGIIVGSSSETNEGFTTAPTPDIVPEEEVRKLLELFRVPEPIEVVSQFLDFFDIVNVVVEGYGFNQIEGSQDSIAFSIKFVSDAPIEADEGLFLSRLGESTKSTSEINANRNVATSNSDSAPST